jgi:hypothetical protein
VKFHEIESGEIAFLKIILRNREHRNGRGLGLLEERELEGLFLIF